MIKVGINRLGKMEKYIILQLLANKYSNIYVSTCMSALLEFLELKFYFCTNLSGIKIFK